MLYRSGMPDVQPRYSIAELADLAGVTPRTVRFYLAQGLLPSPGATGPGVKYGEGHLDRLRLIRRLQRQHLPLAEIRNQLEGLDPRRISMLADAELTPDSVAGVVSPQDTAIDYIRRVLSPVPAASPTAAPAATPGLLKRLAVSERRPPYALSSAPAAPIPTAPPPARSEAPDVIERSQWERISLAADIELHVRRPLPRTTSRKVDRLVTIARELFEEDPA